ELFARGPLCQIAELVEVVGVAMTPEERNLPHALALLRIREGVQDALCSQVEVVHVGPPDAAIGALGIVALDIWRYFVTVLVADKDDRRAHGGAIGVVAVVACIGILAEIPRKGPRRLVIIGDHNVLV